MEHKLSSTAKAPVLIHPKMGRNYRQQVEWFDNALNQEENRAEAIVLDMIACPDSRTSDHSDSVNLIPIGSV